MFHHLTSSELAHAHAAAHYLLQKRTLLSMDHALVVKLDTLRADLTAEQEDRRKIAKS